MLELSWTKIKLIVSLSAFISIKQNSRQNSSFQKILHLQTVSIAVVRFDVQRTLKFQRLSNSVRELAKLTNFSRTNFEILSNLPLSHQRKLFAILISLCLRFVQTCRKYFCSSARERERVLFRLAVVPIHQLKPRRRDQFSHQCHFKILHVRRQFHTGRVGSSLRDASWNRATPRENAPFQPLGLLFQSRRVKADFVRTANEPRHASRDFNEDQ